MEFQILKRSHLKRNILLGIGAVLIVSAIVFGFTSSKYRVAQKGKLTNEAVNSSVLDSDMVAITVDGEKVDTLPDGNYTLTSDSYCEIDGERADVTLNWNSETKALSVTPFTTKGTKCYLHFEEQIQSNVQILATINGSASSTFPSKTSNYTPESVTCTNGAEAKFDYVDWAVEVDNVEKTTCTVNFEENIGESFADYLISKACTSTPTTDDAAKDCLVNENGYRYEGSNPNNYVLFNDELWRVIGVFNVDTESNGTQNLVKLIRNETLDGLAWHGSNTNDWSAATLQEQLNNGYLNATDTTCNVFSTSVIKDCYFSETGLNSTARNMIESVVWNLGGTSSTSATAATFYSAERGTTVYSGRPTTWTGKVGLMYPSDYGYAVLASSCARTTILRNYNTTACAGNNWLKTGSFQWTMTPRSSNSNNVVNVNFSGHLNYYLAYNGIGVRPSIYLKSNIAVMGGDGSIDFPYVIQ